jgi:hypothetical protein
MKGILLITITPTIKVQILQMKGILLITVTPTIKVQILRSLASQKALLIPYLP